MAKKALIAKAARKPKFGVRGYTRHRPNSRYTEWGPLKALAARVTTQTPNLGLRAAFAIRASFVTSASRSRRRERDGEEGSDCQGRS